MRINLQLIVCWLLYITATIILILLWLNKFDVQRDTIDESTHDATVFIRIANFILTSEIILLVSTLYGGFTWYMIQKESIETKHTERWIFYDGGNTLFPTVKVFFLTDLISFKLASMVALAVMIATYFLDIFYVKSISYIPINQCEIRNNTEIDFMTGKQEALANLDRFTQVYAIGSRIGLLPYNNLEYTANTYQVPAIGNTTYLQKYTTIVYNVSVLCQNSIMSIENSSLSAEPKLSVQAEGNNKTYTEMKGIEANNNSIVVIGENTFGFIDNDTYAFFISSATALKEDSQKRFIDMTPITFGSNSIITAYCKSNISYKLVNDDIAGWRNNFDYEQINYLATQASKIPVFAYEAYTATDGFIEWLINGNKVESVNNQSITLSDIEKRITMSMIEFLKGGGINGTTTTVGNYCYPNSYKTNIDPWYKIIFTVVQVIVTLLLTAYSIFFIRKEFVNNDTETLLKYSKSGEDVVLIENR